VSGHLKFSLKALREIKCFIEKVWGDSEFPMGHVGFSMGYDDFFMGVLVWFKSTHDN